MIYLIRHTTPAVARGICYGQTDLDVTGSFREEAEVIRQHLPADIGTVYSSPLKRCTQLAQQLFPDRPLRLMGELMEDHIRNHMPRNSKSSGDAVDDLIEIVRTYLK